MSQDVEIYNLTHWSELEEAATKAPLCDIDLAPFWGSGTAQLTFTSLSGWYEFRRECDFVAALCPPTLDNQLMTLFNWFDEVEEFDAPFLRSCQNLRCTDSSPWYWSRISDGLAGAFNPQTIAAWCEVAKSFSWDECEPFFEEAKQARKNSWYSFKAFSAYGQSWLDHYEEARQQDAGLLICHI